MSKEKGVLLVLMFQTVFRGVSWIGLEAPEDLDLESLGMSL